MARHSLPGPTPQIVGIEDELAFGSDEDLLEDVGEIKLPEINHGRGGAGSHSVAQRYGPSKTAQAQADKRQSGKGMMSKLSMNKSSSSSSGQSNSKSSSKLAGSQLAASSLVFNKEPKEHKGGLMGGLKGLRRKRETKLGSGEDRSLGSVSRTSSQTSLPLLGALHISHRTPTSPSIPSLSKSTTKSSTNPNGSPASYASANASPSTGFSEGRRSATPTRLFDSRTNDAERAAASRSGSPVPILMNSAEADRVNVHRPSLTDIPSVLLPAFPTTIESLESIAILHSMVLKQFSNSRSGIPESSIPWIPHQIVLTYFKMGQSNVIAHIHLFEGAPSALRKIRLDRREVEVERRLIGGESWVHSEGLRMVMHFDTDGEGDWVFEFTDEDEMDDWISQTEEIMSNIKTEVKRSQSRHHLVSVAGSSRPRGSFSAGTPSAGVSPVSHSHPTFAGDAMTRGGNDIPASNHRPVSEHYDPEVNTPVSEKRPPSWAGSITKPLPMVPKSPPPVADSRSVIDRGRNLIVEYADDTDLDPRTLAPKSQRGSVASTTSDFASPNWLSTEATSSVSHRDDHQQPSLPAERMRTAEQSLAVAPAMPTAASFPHPPHLPSRLSLGSMSSHTSSKTAMSGSSKVSRRLAGATTIPPPKPAPPSGLALPPVPSTSSPKIGQSVEKKMLVSPALAEGSSPYESATYPLVELGGQHSTVNPETRIPMMLEPAIRMSRTDSDMASIRSETSKFSQTSLSQRKLMLKSAVVDIMQEFNASEAGQYVEEEDLPTREDRARKIRFAEE